MANLEELRGMLRKVIDFNGRSIMAKLNGAAIAEEELRSVREACKCLGEAGVFPFDADCTDEALMKQISAFVQKGLKDSE